MFPKRNVLASQSGTSALEFALIAPVAVTMLLGVVNFGLPIYYQMQLQTAVRAAAQYMNATSDATQVATIIDQATLLDGIVVDSPTSSCLCGGETTAVECDTSCGDGNAIRHYWTITAHYTYTPIITYFSTGPQTLTYSKSIRTTQ